jgi:UDP-N-acetylmuramate dehydrogenase
MKLVIEENVNLSEFCTMHVGGVAKYFTRVASESDVKEALEWVKERNLRYFILGGGSNTIFASDSFEGLVIKNEIKGFEVVGSFEEFSLIQIGAGENWDGVVEKSVELGLSGIEALSLIPGTAGATPVQNVGAYGQEIKDTLALVHAIDTTTGEAVVLAPQECNFRYRDSIFKTEEKGRYIISSIILRLSKNPPAFPTFKALVEYFAQNSITEPTLSDIRNAVITLRTSKLPDPSTLPNTGSFFENPIISQEKFKSIYSKFPEIVNYPTDNGKVKLFAGWLIDSCGLKGLKYNSFGIYEKNALVIVNHANGSYSELKEITDFIISKVNEKFGIVLEQEPENV